MPANLDHAVVLFRDYGVSNWLLDIVGHQARLVLRWQVEEGSGRVKSAMENVRADSMVDDLP
jgi:hypothetical protein